MTDSKRVRLPRKAAATVSYAEQADALTDNDDDDEAAHLERERAAKRKKAGKGKQKEEKAQQPVKPQEPDDAYLWRPVPEGIMSKAVKGQPAAYTPRRIDPTAFLPSEIILEICSYMRPITLWRILYLNKRMYTLLSSASGLALWHAAIDDTADEYSGIRYLAAERRAGLAPLPLDGGRPVSLIKVAGLLFSQDCQSCGSTGASAQFDVLLRLCEACQTTRFISLSDLRKDPEFEYLHPLTVDLTQSVLHTAGQRWSKGPFALKSEIQHVHEQLEDLQMQDDATARNSAASASTGSSRRSGRARPSTERGGSQADTSGQPDSLVAKYSRQREERLLEEVKIAGWIYDRDGRAHNKAQRIDEDEEGHRYWEAVRAGRCDAFMAQIEADTPFRRLLVERMIPDWTRHPDISRSHPLSGEEWQAIKPRLCASIGRCIAHNLVTHHGLPPIPKSRVKLDSVMQRVSEQPPLLDDAVWTFVRSQIDVVIEALKADALAEDADLAARRAETQRSAKIRAKKAFFRTGLDDMRAAQQNEAAQTTLPILIDFVTLPTVRSLYDDADFAVDERQNERDLTTWRQHVDAVDEEVDVYRVQVRLQALQQILAATTNKSADELETIDADALLDPAFDESFFARPSSLLSCTTCEISNFGWYPDGFGPVDSVLRHRHERHAWLSLPEPVGLQKTSSAATMTQPESELGATISPVRLPLELACVLLSICELGDLDPNDPTLSPTDLEVAFEEWRLVWRNAELGKTSRHKCGELIRSVLADARTAERSGKVLPVPDIVRRSLNWRERRNLETRRLNARLAAANPAKQNLAVARIEGLGDEDNENEDDGDADEEDKDDEDENEDEDEELARSWMDAGSVDENTVDGHSHEDEEEEEDGGETSE